MSEFEKSKIAGFVKGQCYFCLPSYEKQACDMMNKLIKPVPEVAPVEVEFREEYHSDEDSSVGLLNANDQSFSKKLKRKDSDSSGEDEEVVNENVKEEAKVRKCQKGEKSKPMGYILSPKVEESKVVSDASEEVKGDQDFNEDVNLPEVEKTVLMETFMDLQGAGRNSNKIEENKKLQNSSFMEREGYNCDSISYSYRNDGSI